jgi:site-specific recombinase XerC
MTGETDEIKKIKEQLSNDPSDELLESLAATIVAEMEDSFPELSFKIQAIEDTIESFRDEKLEEVDSEQQYATKIDYVLEYFVNEVGVETTDDLTSEDIGRFDTWRKYESLTRENPLSDKTLSDDMYLFDEFVAFMIEHKLVPARFAEQVEQPDTDPEKGDGVSEKKLDPELAQASLEYLRKYEYADVEHVVMELFCGIAARRSDLVGRDTSDFKKGEDGEHVLAVEHDEVYQLKNDEGGSRDVTLYGDLPEIIQDYLDGPRPDVTDDEGNKPLLSKGNGRIASSTLKKIAYKWTRPCEVGLGCPHDRDPKQCEAAQKANSAYKCPSSRAPHHIRKGYITDNRNAGVSPRAIEQRCDANPRTQKIHYDQPDQDAERQRYEDEFQNREEDPDSGFRP